MVGRSSAPGVWQARGPPRAPPHRRGAPAWATFSAFAASLFEDEVEAGDIRSASGRVKWAQTLEHHLLPAFGSLLLDQIRHADIAKWRVRMAEKIHDGTYSPHTVNTWLQVLRVILKAAVVNLGCWRGRGKAPAYASRLIWWLAHGARGPRRCTTSSRPTNRRRRYVHGVGRSLPRDEASPA